MFIDGFLGLATSVTPQGITEWAGSTPPYARQPVSFGEPVNGICYSASPYTFGQGSRGGVMGRALYDAPAGGNLLLFWPFPTPLAPDRLGWDSGDQGYLRLAFSALAGYPRGAAFTGRFAAGAVVGSASDRNDVVSVADTSVDPANPRPRINVSPLYAGVALSIARGVLQAASAVPSGSE